MNKNKTLGEITGKFITLLNPETGAYSVSYGFKKVGEVNMGSEEQPNLVNEYEYYSSNFDHKPSLVEIKDLVVKHYNTECDKEIVSGCRFENELVWLSQENQFNYKAAFDRALQKESTLKEGEKNPLLPVIFKVGDEYNPVYKVFNTIDDLGDFIDLTLNHVLTTLGKYWEIKNTIDWTKYEE